MMAAAKTDMLPQVRGKLEFNVPLGEKLWFGTGGNAEILFKPEDVQDLQSFLQGKPSALPHIVIGAGSNIIIRDKGLAGITIRLRKAFSQIAIDGDILQCGSGALDVNVAKAAELASLTGLEFFAGIPGCIGGAVKMNAGAMGTECKDFLLDCEVLDGQGNQLILKKDDLDYAYRSSSLADDWVVVSVRFQLEKAAPSVIADKMQAVKAHRQEAQLIGKTGGSTFKNPYPHKAWELIDAAGCRGLKVGGAYMSEKHCNFMFNDGTATASDLERLGEEVKARVLTHSGVELQWEIKRLGLI